MEKEMKQPWISCTDVEGNFSLRQGEASLYIPDDFTFEESCNFLKEAFYKVLKNQGKANVGDIRGFMHVMEISLQNRIDEDLNGCLTKEDFMNNE